MEDPILYTDEREQSVYQMGRLHAAREIRQQIDELIIGRCDEISHSIETADTSFDSALKTLFSLEKVVAKVMRESISG